MTRLLRVFGLAAAVSGGAFIVACDTSANLPPASQENVVDTVRMYALRGTPITQPSGFHLPTRLVMRTDQPGFDIAFDIDNAGTPLMYPAGALGLAPDAAILKMTTSFVAIEVAPLNNDYVSNAPLAIPPGTVFVVRSAPFGGDCGLTGALPRYGKFRSLSLDPVARSIDLEVLVDVNCGYRDLNPGVPVT